MLSTLGWKCRRKLFPFGGDIPFKKNPYVWIRIVCCDVGLPGQRGKVAAGQDMAGLKLFAWLVLKTGAPGLILCCTCVQSCCRCWGGVFFVWGRLFQGESTPLIGTSCAVSSAPFPVKSSCCLITGKGLFLCLPRHGVNCLTVAVRWEGNWARRLPGPCRLPRHPHLATARGCPLSLLPGWDFDLESLLSGPYASSIMTLVCGIRPLPLHDPFSCVSLVIDAQLWFESLSLGKEVNWKGEIDTLIKGTT